ncbi:hypothetical protein CBR_g61485 [Chara braunii]|uniref:peptidylprolyl isomerase n=1 Tax=Chara braunii TaxID=69332 RepID=A0A388K8Q5_CHABU|nr:hypothetical protein CBR_g61485 [Chara braunii]|eukprot:GBG66442.1 hypothetical protein CBR_g61485 [Chara braunii]
MDHAVSIFFNDEASNLPVQVKNSRHFHKETDVDCPARSKDKTGSKSKTSDGKKRSDGDEDGDGRGGTEKKAEGKSDNKGDQGGEKWVKVSVKKVRGGTEGEKRDPKGKGKKGKRRRQPSYKEVLKGDAAVDHDRTGTGTEKIVAGDKGEKEEEKELERKGKTTEDGENNNEGSKLLGEKSEQEDQKGMGGEGSIPKDVAMREKSPDPEFREEDENTELKDPRVTRKHREERSPAKDKGTKDEEEEELELEESEWETSAEEAEQTDAQAEDLEAARKREEIAAGKRQLEFASGANLQIADDPTRDPEFGTRFGTRGFGTRRFRTRFGTREFGTRFGTWGFGTRRFGTRFGTRGFGTRLGIRFGISSSIQIGERFVKMGVTSSRPEEIAALAQSLGRNYRPPLGPPRKGNCLVYFDIRMGRFGDGIPIGRIVFELKEDLVPITTENFKQLCLRPQGQGYRGSRFHRIIPGFMCQGGDFTHDNGTGGRSIYGGRFIDENLGLPHCGPGILSMANSGANTNGSQFFICLAPTPWLNGKHVVFGQVVEGFGVLKAMETYGSRTGDTTQDIIIGDSGVVEDSASAQLLAHAKMELRTLGGSRGSKVHSTDRRAAAAPKVALMRLNRVHRIPRSSLKLQCEAASLCTGSSPLSDGNPRRAIIINYHEQYLPAAAKV